MKNKGLIRHYLKRAVLEAGLLALIAISVYSTCEKDLRMQRKLDGVYEEIMPPSDSAKEEAPININTASAHQLQRLKGIGEAKAQAIVDYREEHGSFSSPEELVNVKGIGEKLLASIVDKITV